MSDFKVMSNNPNDNRRDHVQGICRKASVTAAGISRGRITECRHFVTERTGVGLGGNTEIIARARTEIEAMRMMVLRAAKAMDTLGNAEARVWISAVKAMVPERVCRIIDQAIQMHGATGVSQWTPLADMYQSQRTLRLADGPDEVHWMVVGRSELAGYEGLEVPVPPTSVA